MTAVRIYTPEPLPHLPVYAAFKFKYPHSSGQLFRDAPIRFFEQRLVSSAEQADAIVLANNFLKQPDDRAEAYVREWADRAEALGKPLFVFACGDLAHQIVFDPRAWSFRFSLYRSVKGPRDIALPAVTEEPPQELVYIRDKHEVPMVAFCGMGDFKSRRERVKFYVKDVAYSAGGLFSRYLQARRAGVHWRRAMMHACEHSPLVQTNFIVRSSYSGNRKTIELDPARARREYLEASAHADFVISPKGYGNYSNRFIKTLAFGRVPILVDTDVALPLEDVIDYSKIIVRVPMERVRETPQCIREFYDALSAEEWAQCQKAARDAFTHHLKQDAFFEEFFARFLSGAYR